nr:hypothetical protein [uncultured Prevotella sp.]
MAFNGLVVQPSSAAAVYVWNNKVSPVIEHAGAWNDAINKKLPLVGKSVSGKNVFKWTYDGPRQVLLLKSFSWMVMEIR